MSLTSSLLPESLLIKLPEFEKKIMSLATVLGIDLLSYQVDHIAIRVNEWNLAEQSHQAWKAYGQEWSKAEINGRPIVIIGFEQPLVTQLGEIEALELPYPNQKQYPTEGWEHIEVVVPCDATKITTTEELKQHLWSVFPRLKQGWETLETDGIKVKASSPSGENERLPNPTYAFKKDGVCIKLHPYSLKAVLESERA